MSILKIAVLLVLAWIGLRWLSQVYSSEKPNVGDGSIVGRGWAPPVSTAYPVRAWAPPYGVVHEGGGSQP